MRSASTTKKSESKKKTAARRAPAKAPPKPRLVRGEAVVQKVHDAAIRELAEVGFRGFRIEEVALRAQVNKTTVYRRWPTKVDLVRDTLSSVSARRMVVLATGSLRSDLFALARVFLEHVTDPVGQGLFRMLTAEGSDPELMGILRSLRERNEAVARTVITSAVARGELAPGIDHTVILHALIGALHHQVFFLQETVDDAFVTALIDLLLCGARR